MTHRILLALVCLALIVGALPQLVAATAPRTIAIGDQLTAGNAAYPAAWRGQLYTLQALGGSPLTFVGTLTDPTGLKHDGHAGANLASLTSNVATYIATQVPERVLLMAGSNDILTNVPPATALTRMTALLDAIDARHILPGNLYLATIPDAVRSTQIKANIQAYNAGLAQLAVSRGYHLVDVYAYVNPATDLGPDGVTLNGSGNAAVAAAFHDALP